MTDHRELAERAKEELTQVASPNWASIDPSEQWAETKRRAARGVAALLAAEQENEKLQEEAFELNDLVILARQENERLREALRRVAGGERWQSSWYRAVAAAALAPQPALADEGGVPWMAARRAARSWNRRTKQPAPPEETGLAPNRKEKR